MLLRFAVALPLAILVILSACSDTSSSPATTSSCTYERRSACAADTACTWCEGLPACRPKSEAGSKTCDNPGEGEACSRKGEMRCFGAKAYLCDGATLKGVFQCTSSSPNDRCLEASDKASVSCPTESFATGPSAFTDQPCFTDGATACAVYSPTVAVLTCTSGTWRATTTCTSSQTCKVDAANKPTCQ